MTRMVIEFPDDVAEALQKEFKSPSVAVSHYVVRHLRRLMISYGYLEAPRKSKKKRP